MFSKDTDRDAVYVLLCQNTVLSYINVISFNFPYEVCVLRKLKVIKGELENVGANMAL